MLNELDKNILNKIITSESHLSGAFLSQLCNVSINTIRKEIDIINDYISEHGCHIETKIAQGYVFVVDNELIAVPFIDQLLIDYRRYRYLNLSELSSVYYVVRKLLVSGDYHTPESLADDMFCSKSTILRILDKAKDFLSFYHLEIKSKRNYGIQIEGNEWNRRICMLDLHKAYIHSNELEKDIRFEAAFLMNSNYPFQVRKILQKYFEQHPELKINNLNFAKLYNLILLCETRKSQDSKLKFTSEQILAAKQLKTWNHAEEIYHLLPSYFQNFSTNSIACLAMLLAASRTITSSKEIPQKEAYVCHQETLEMIDFISKYYHIHQLIDNEFIHDFSCYLYSLNLSLLFNIPTDQEMLTPSFRLGLLTADLLSLFALFFYQKHGCLLKETDLVKSYYIFSRTLFNNQQFHSKKRILLCSRYGYYFSKNLAQRAKESFSRYIEQIDVVEFSELYALDLNQYDILATDISLKGLPETSIPIININFYRTKNDMAKLQKYIADNQKKMALSIFQEENLHKFDFKSKEEILNQFYRFYRNEVGDQERFYRDINLRESFVNSERDKGIVFISTLALRMNRPVFEVIVTQKPVLWNNQRSTVFIFYQHGDGTLRNMQLISYLLTQFIHKSDSYINSLYKLRYNEIIKSFSM